MSAGYFQYRSLEDFVAATPLSIDDVFDDGWGAPVVLKGVEIDATILFADIRDFTERAAELSAPETLAFVNTFFTWMSAETMRTGHGIVDKYIGDEMMIVYSEAFGSNDSFIEALRAARAMAERDALGYVPRFGIASGRVIVGFVGTPVKFNCSVFGRTVAIAKRCAQIESSTPYGYGVHFPADLWRDRDLMSVFPRRKLLDSNGKEYEDEVLWEISESRPINAKNGLVLDVRELRYPLTRMTSFDLADRARDVVRKATNSE